MKRILFILAVLALLVPACDGNKTTPGVPPPTPVAEDTSTPPPGPTATIVSPTATPAPSATATDTPPPTPSPVPLLQVPAEYLTIQAAIDAAQDGDTIVVSPGTYAENIDFRGKSITVRSSDPDDPEVVAATIIDGGGQGTVVTFSSGETVRAVLSGFTITNGSGTKYRLQSAQDELSCRGSIFGSPEVTRFCGGGIVVEGSWPTIEHNVVTGNKVSHGGAGIFVAEDAFPTIRNNTISGNEASSGSGIFVVNGSWPTIESNVIRDNWAESAGGGIFVDLHSAPRIEGNAIGGNEASVAAGIMVFNYSVATIRGNTIHDNKSGQSGGAIFAGAFSTLTLVDNSFSGNEAVLGGAIFCEIETSLEILGNTFDANVALFEGGGIHSAGCFLRIVGNTFDHNRAEYGAGIDDRGNLSLIVEGNVFAGNEAQYGAGTCHTGQYAATVVGNEFQNNVAQEGGAIWVSHDFDLTLGDPDENVYVANQPDDVRTGAPPRSTDPAIPPTATSVPPLSDSEGRMIAFVSKRDGNYEIYVMSVPHETEADGVEPSSPDPWRLTHNEADDWAPAWSPDGTQLAFSSERDGNWEIYVMTVPYVLGAEQGALDQRRLTYREADDWDPDWSPDGTQIVFHSERGDGSFDIWLMNADGSDQRRLANTAADEFHLDWSPDGTQFAFESTRDGNYQIYVMDAEGDAPSPLSQRRLTSQMAGNRFPAWSPDGSRIAFNSKRDGNDEIYVMDAGGSNLQRLTFNDDEDWDPAWSPDGTQLAFRSKRDGNWEIYVMVAPSGTEADGDEPGTPDPWRLTHNEADEHYPAWRPFVGPVDDSPAR